MGEHLDVVGWTVHIPLMVDQSEKALMVFLGSPEDYSRYPGPFGLPVVVMRCATEPEAGELVNRLIEASYPDAQMLEVVDS